MSDVSVETTVVYNLRRSNLYLLFSGCFKHVVTRHSPSFSVLDFKRECTYTMAAVLLWWRKAEDVLQAPPLTSWCWVELFLATDSQQQSLIVCYGDWGKETNVFLFLPFPCVWASEQRFWCEVLRVWGQRDGKSWKEKKVQGSGDDRGPVWGWKADRKRKLNYHRIQIQNTCGIPFDPLGNDDLSIFKCFCTVCVCVY